VHVLGLVSTVGVMLFAANLAGSTS
jgi:hypothetical protein